MVKKRKPYAGFGKELRSLMLDRDIQSWTQLEEIIERKTGQSFTHQSMSKYAAGTVKKIPHSFVKAFTAALNLNEEERLNLAEKYTYESDPEANGNGLQETA